MPQSTSPTIKISVFRTAADEEPKAFPVEESHPGVQSPASTPQYLSLLRGTTNTYYSLNN
jgi:hypothetical protein